MECRGRRAVVWIDAPPVNALSHAVRRGLLDAVGEVARDDTFEGAVIACRGRTFIAGADVKEFGAPPREPDLRTVIAAIEASAKPIIAAMHGTALGGGLEVALGCHGRVMAVGAKAGLPEVKLGLVPGAGGTQRLPRLVGMIEAARMITSGEPVSAERAARIGLVDRVARGDLVEEALAYLDEMKGKVPEGARLSQRPPAQADTDEVGALLREALAKAMRRGMGASPALAAPPLWAAMGPFEEGMRIERETFEHLRASDQSKALRHVFFAERAASKLPVSAEPRELARVGVIGAGTMGTGIALAVLAAGLPVTLVETNEDGLERGTRRVADTLASMAEKGRISADEAATRRAMLAGTLRMEDLAEADLVIEAAFEDMAVKREIFARLGALARPGAVLVTNTSYLDVDEIARASGRPKDVLGLHFFSPAHIMKLLEIVRGSETADDALATGHALARRLGKLPVVAGNAFGFIGNRVFSDYRKQAEFIVEEGASPAEVDEAMRGFGMAMGPFEVADLAGLDIARAVRRMNPPGAGERGSPLADALCERGRMGRKSATTVDGAAAGGGWYDYPGGARVPSAEVAALIAAHRKERGIEPRAFFADEIVARLSAAMANAGAHVVGEGTARGPGDVDVALVNGYGYPRYRGGPLHYASQVGWAKMAADAQLMCEAGGSGWQVADWLVQRAREERPDG